MGGRSWCCSVELKWSSSEAIMVPDDMLFSCYSSWWVRELFFFFFPWLFKLFIEYFPLFSFVKILGFDEFSCIYFLLNYTSLNWLWSNRRFIRRCKQGGLQFVILKPILVVITFILYAKGKYEDGNFSVDQAYLYITIMYTISYSMALYALALFYVACRDLLRPFNPVPKFIMIKSVVFLTYWQVFFLRLILFLFR